MIAKTAREPRLEPAATDRDVSRRISQLARTSLSGSGYAALAEVTCEFENGVLTLRGNVPSFYMKQMAQTLVRGVSEVQHIDNRVEVS